MPIYIRLFKHHGYKMTCTPTLKRLILTRIMTYGSHVACLFVEVIGGGMLLVVQTGMNMAKHGTIKSRRGPSFIVQKLSPTTSQSQQWLHLFHPQKKKAMVPVTRDPISPSAINLQCQSSSLDVVFEQQFRENQRLSPNPHKKCTSIDPKIASLHSKEMLCT